MWFVVIIVYLWKPLLFVHVTELLVRFLFNLIFTLRRLALSFTCKKSKASDVGISSVTNEGAALFTNDNSREGQPEQFGECFVILRDPTDRAIAVFSQLKTSPRWENVNIVSYAKGAEIENNWMTRSITGKLNGGEVTEVDLLAAKYFSKIVV